MGDIPGIRKIKEVRALCDRSSVRRRTGLFVTEGERIYKEIPPEDLVSVYVSESYKKSHPGMKADHVLRDTEFARLADTKHPQGILAVVRQKRYRIGDMLDGNLYIVLETLQDPGNLGTVIRTAEAAGVSAVIMNKGCADIYSPKVVRSTMGSVFRVPFIYTEDLTAVLRDMKRAGITLYAAELRGRDINDTGLSDRRAFIIGNEGNGLTEETLRMADERVSIPMAGRVESLNAAVTAAILMYHGMRKS
ncbi:MAG: RNA methyltransferase [Lachnospiraceae bacterium]|nr:RNA methyltransferase [Lachnospiraceae bacterium]